VSERIQSPGIILAADWAKNPAKRAVYEADVRDRSITKLECSQWTLESILTVARSHKQHSVLVSMDLVLGVPRPYWREASGVKRWRQTNNFLDWLGTLGGEDTFWQEVRSPEDWNVLQPFFAVPGGAGSMTAFHTKAGYSLFRKPDRRCQANPPFCVSGIPGTVGSGTRALWQELSPMLAERRDFRVWPFEGSLDQLLTNSTIVIAEGYPGIAYTAALRESLPARRLKVAKTKRQQREAALGLLTNATWVTNHSVAIHDLDEALASEDDFDALMSAAGLLRCVLENYALDEPDCDDRIAEGGVLLTSAIDFEKKAAKLERQVDKPDQLAIHVPGERWCPIPGCTKMFKRGIAGWDSHVASARIHSQWHPECVEPEERKKHFKREFPDWMGPS
jgi:hypothetical protein